MNGEMVAKALRQVEMGEAGMSEAEVLRQALAELEIQRVVSSNAQGHTLQRDVLGAVTARGYREGWTDQPFMARQVAKAVEELGELAALFDFGNGHWSWVRKIGDVRWDAHDAFDVSMGWNEATVSGDLATEVADVMIPLLCIAEVAGFDALEAVRRKALGDVSRGKRQTLRQVQGDGKGVQNG